MTDIPKLTASLSEATKISLIEAEDTEDGAFCRCRVTSTIAAELCSKRLGSHRGWLSNLGLAVRAHLQAEREGTLP